MKDWKRALISSDVTMRAAIAHIDESALQIAIVVDPDGHLLGTVTDGDVRRSILRGLSIDTSVQDIMNRNPTTALRNDSREHIVALMRQRSLRQIPVLDDDRRITGLEVFDEILASPVRPNTAILMATPFSTCCKIMDCLLSATSLSISTPLFIGPGCMMTISLCNPSNNLLLIP